ARRPCTSIHVVRRVLDENIRRRDQLVAGDGPGWDRLTTKHAHGEGEDVVAVPVQVERDRADHDAAAIAWIDLLALAHSPVDRAVGSVADDRAVGQPTRRLEGALGSQRRRVVQGSDEELLAWLARHEPADELADARSEERRVGKERRPQWGPQRPNEEARARTSGR